MFFNVTTVKHELLPLCLQRAYFLIIDVLKEGKIKIATYKFNLFNEFKINSKK